MTAGAYSPPQPSTCSKARLHELDSLRGVAALAVVLWHYSRHFHAAPLHGLLSPFYSAGIYAVDFFFVLSGMVLARAYGVEQRRERFADNVVRRVARLYPLHFATLLFVAGVQGALVWGFEAHPFIIQDNDTWHFVLNLFMAHFIGFQEWASFTGPSWSISTEFWVNVLFFALLLGTRRIVPLAIGLVAISFAVVVNTGNGALLGDTRLHPFLAVVRTTFGFFVGVLLYQVGFERERLARVPAGFFDVGFVASASALLAGSLGWLSVGPRAEMFSVLIGFPALILCAAKGRWVKAVLRLGPFVHLGEISYSVYMIHFPLQAVLHLMTVAGWIAPYYGDPLVLGAFILSTLGLASLSYRFVELPAQRGINRLWDGRRAAANRH